MADRIFRRRLYGIVAVSGSGLVLDGLTTGIKAAYSTRKLLTAYAGKAIRVQRISDNAQQDIGFVNNALDTGSLSSFCSGTTGKIVTWYDQSGGGFDQTQGTIANAAIIFQSGSTNTINSQAAPLFSGGTPTFVENTSLSANPTNTQFNNAVLSVTATFSSNGVTGSNNTGGWEFRVNSGVPSNLELLNSASASLGTSSGGGFSQNSGAIVEVSYNASSGAGAFWVNRLAAGTFTTTTTFTPRNSRIGVGFGTSEGFDGSIGEVIMYDLVGGVSGTTRQSIENNQKTFWGTP